MGDRPREPVSWRALLLTGWRVVGDTVVQPKDDGTATTAMLTDIDEMFSDSDTESDDGEDFAAENAPRPPPRRYCTEATVSPILRDGTSPK